MPKALLGGEQPVGKVIDTPSSHVDVYPFVLEAVGENDPALTENFSGVSLFDLADGAVPERNVLVEYHGMGSTTGSFMIRHGKYKYIYYVAYPAQLFDLEADPEELHDLGTDPARRDVLAECHTRLLRICDPDAVECRVRARQAVLLEANGGRDAVIARGDLGFTPAPGAAIAFD